MIQDVSFTEENGDAMSLDECLELLAETFPVEEPEVSMLTHLSPQESFTFYSLKTTVYVLSPLEYFS